MTLVIRNLERGGWVVDLGRVWFVLADNGNCVRKSTTNPTHEFGGVERRQASWIEAALVKKIIQEHTKENSHE